MTCDSCRLEPGVLLVWFPGQAPLPAPVFFVCRRCLGGVRDGQRMRVEVVDLEQSGLGDLATSRRRS
jgi:hypothetical protein